MGLWPLAHDTERSRDRQRMPSSNVRMLITTSWKSLSPVVVDTSSKPICSSRPPGVTPDRTWTVPSGELKPGLKSKPGTACDGSCRPHDLCWERATSVTGRGKLIRTRDLPVAEYVLRPWSALGPRHYGVREPGWSISAA